VRPTQENEKSNKTVTGHVGTNIREENRHDGPPGDEISFDKEKQEARVTGLDVWRRANRLRA